MKSNHDKHHREKLLIQHARAGRMAEQARIDLEYAMASDHVPHEELNELACVYEELEMIYLDISSELQDINSTTASYSTSLG